MSRKNFYSKSDVYEYVIFQLNEIASAINLAKIVVKAMEKPGVPSSPIIDEEMKRLKNEIPEMDLQERVLKATIKELQDKSDEHRLLASKGLAERI